MNTLNVTCLYGLLLMAGCFLAGCKPQENALQQPLPVVSVSEPQKFTFDSSITATGTVSASEQVQIAARVAATLQSVNFKDGDLVQAGQVLFTLDSAALQAQLNSAQAALVNAQRETDRDNALYPSRVISLSTLQDAQTARDQALAQRDIAKINLDYTRITAPFTGRIGRRTVDVGNLVGTSGNTVLATLNKIDPLYVTFSLNQSDATRFGIIAGRRDAVTHQPLDIIIPGLSEPLHSTVDFVDNQLDSASGNLTLRATLHQPPVNLLPGMFVQVTLRSAEPLSQFQLPSTAVQGDSIFPVSPDGRVSRLSVKTAPGSGEHVILLSANGNTQRVLTFARPDLVGKKVNVSNEARSQHD
ncbi:MULTISPECIES: efflux RND transporter periplasmic adaptor subunit [Pantoea]|uniref:efflux RND transporter periplasmic adaptor subunit n=1 Tax=Pantoea TaxID=53335 RepID=UPI0019807C8D|nr:efflux RND transporter periplasmic adaptor subunit [Pantoea stewartii]